jgi:hypothetical protein
VIASRERTLLQSISEEEMLAAHSRLVAAVKSGPELLFALLADVATRTGKASEEYQKTMLLNQSKELTELKNQLADRPHFIQEPVLPAKQTISPLPITLFIGLLGLFIGLAYQFRRQLKPYVLGLIRDEESSNLATYKTEK